MAPYSARRLAELREEVRDATTLQRALSAAIYLHDETGLRAVSVKEVVDWVAAHYVTLTETELDEVKERYHASGYKAGTYDGDEAGYRRGVEDEKRRRWGQPQLMYASMEQLAEELLTRVRSLEPSLRS